MTRRIVIGIGNSFRRDDGVGMVVADEVARRNLPGVCVLAAIAEPVAMLDTWGGAELAVVVDAATGAGSTPGRVQRWTPGGDVPVVLSSHALGLAQTYALGRALGRIPDELVVLTVDVADTGNGVGLTPAVAAAVPAVVQAVLAELER
ncbi:peptidase M52 [Mycolicibacterium peregrinum]|uniref:hydrogenase maturation protease n=1 Tax=Mycolicibacterium peregrinum TaxID=43304 RepID=UPI0006D7A403|nr:hydrogenase maturation protease [Mycolicibacterium peregrinum]MCV7204279.1 hydrogenase maturation protease [Mycolicibacterium peregrinum]ORW50693.1 peptidase M52 [Mycolicibacterium peregrinum]OWL93649.1 peptidase M52 [Mycolicibacterium peregrinum]